MMDLIVNQNQNNANMGAQRYQGNAPYVDAIQWTGNNLEAIKEFLGTHFVSIRTERSPYGKSVIEYQNGYERPYHAERNDYIIKDDAGAFSTFDPVMFHKTYNRVLTTV